MPTVLLFQKFCQSFQRNQHSLDELTEMTKTTLSEFVQAESDGDFGLHGDPCALFPSLEL